MATRRFFLFGAALIALASSGWSQDPFPWRVFKFTDGLPDSACQSVFIAQPGKVLVENLNSWMVTELDGYSTSTFPGPPVLVGRIRASPGGQLWAVGPSGLQELRDGNWVTHPVPEIAAELQSTNVQTSCPVPIHPVRQDRVIFLLHDRLMDFAAEKSGSGRTTELRAAGRTEIGEFSGMAIARDGGMWIAGKRGIARTLEPVRNLKPDSVWHDFPVPASLQVHNLRALREDETGGVTLLGDSADGIQAMAVFFDGQRWSALPIAADSVQCVWRGPGMTGWAMTPERLLHWEQSGTLTTNQDISVSQYFDVATEPGGIFWLATSDGLFRYTPSIWRKPVAAGEVSSLVHSLAADAEGRIWFVANNQLHVIENDSSREYPLPAPFRNPQTSRAMFSLKDSSLLLASGGRLLQFEPAKGSFEVVSPRGEGHSWRLLGQMSDGIVCLLSAGRNARLETYDGREMRPFPDPPEASGPDAGYTTLFAARGGDLWLGGEGGIAWFREKRWRRFEAKDHTAPAGVVCFAELADGRIWCATQRDLWEFDGQDWLLLRTGFDRINALLQSRDGSVWVASNNGLHRFFHRAWIENGVEDGLPDASVREVCEDRRGRVWVATARGPAVYCPEADPDPPRTFIHALPDSQARVPEGSRVDLAFTARDKWKHTLRHRLLYSHRLDENEWSLFQDYNTVSFDSLAPGKHTFKVRAMDRNGNIDPNPPLLEFIVALPWYKETRLVLIGLLGLVAALSFAVLAVNRHRQLLRSYAEVERKVADRTRELEIASRELLQSQKMNALGTLAAGIAHDFNNILSIIKGSAQIIEDNVDNPGKIRTRVDRIKTVVEQGAGIVKAMLGFSRDSDGQPGRCNPNNVVEDTIRLLGDRFLREAEVKFEPGPDLPEIAVSKDFIQQILLNFIFNAAEAMTGRKRIAIATRTLGELPPGVVLAPAPAAQYVAILVRDTGCGIPPENLSRIFEPFFTTKALSTRRGTGLGLSMAYELAKKMEAGLAVESVVGQGSTFTLIVPVRQANA
jgi:signal transduction histidine kinase/ligand-binding sensor domain-containing protein